eukprot:TRINITY_DN2731_c0_g1_i1.p1 TRINITY_DN2731_c0_g1~~TRINITY_DN2731_c0_g1_i1.p1  ORF type:complete len:369 (-),score=88.70 TRINITY_DN2731_c0_g1_i1:134-1240(-)
MEQSLDTLLNGYREMDSALKLVSIFKSQCDTIDPELFYSVDTQQKVLSMVVNDEHCLKFPPSSHYTVKFLKAIIDQIEQENKELDEELLNQLFHYQSLAKRSSARDLCFKSYKVKDSLIQIKMANQMDNVGLTSWEAGFYLAEFIADNPELFIGKNVLELGTGIGLTGVAMAKIIDSYISEKKISTIKKTKIILTDYTEEIIENIKYNVIINDLKVNTDDSMVDVLELDWENPSPESLMLKPQILIAADLVYDPGLITALVPIIKTFLELDHDNSSDDHSNVNVDVGSGSSGSSCYPCAYVATTRRNPKTFEFYLETLKKNGIDHRDITPLQSTTPIFNYKNKQNIVLSYLTMDKNNNNNNNNNTIPQ